MFYREHGHAHFHAEYQAQQATFNFNGEVLDGSIQSKTALRLIKEWATAHRPNLEANWESGRTGRPMERIEPLE